MPAWKPSRDTVSVIADIGKNFIQTADERSLDEYLANAKTLVDAAVEAGVDVVKFQTHTVEDEQLPIDIHSPHFAGMDRYNWVKRNTFTTPTEFWQEINAHCEKRGIPFFSTPMSRGAAQKLSAIDVPLWKVSSGDVRDNVLLEYLISTKKPIIISTGMVSLSELDTVVTYLLSHNVDLTILYCISKYPCPPEEFNLSTITLFQKKYPDCIIGFSDHSIGHEAALGAINVGARIIEKHFSLSRELWGPDHKVSMTPAELKALMHAIRGRDYEKVDPSAFLGDMNRELEGAQNAFRPYFGKVLVAAQNIDTGTTLTSAMISAMRPIMHCPGLPAHELHRLVGRTTKVPLKQYDPITEDSLASS